MLEPRVINRLKHLAQPAHERWEGGVVRLPTWIEQGPDGRPYRPHAALWVSPLRHKVHVALLEPGVDQRELLTNLFVEFATKSKYAECLPSLVHVPDEEQAQTLREALGALPVEVSARSELPHLNDIVNQMLSETGHPPLPGMLSAPGVTLEALRAFADAARRFWDARPWTELQTSDLIRIDAPDQGPELRFATVLGSEGTLRGIGFLRSPDEHDALEEGVAPSEALSGRRWLLTFGSGWEMAPDDADVWEREGLPLADEEAHPLLARVELGGPARRPDAGQLAWFEGILLALSDSSPEEFDAGRWAKDVMTSQGPMRFELALPDLADAPDDAGDAITDEAGTPADFFARFLEDRELSAVDLEDGAPAPPDEDNARGPRPRTPAQQALALAFEARRLTGRRQLQVIRRSLELWPDCADAHLLLGDREPDTERALTHYEEAVRTAERTLPPEARQQPVPAGVYGDDPRTRPYLRARAALAEGLLEVDRYEEAREHLLELLRLHPGDNKGHRFTLLVAAIEHRDAATGGDLVRMFSDDDSALFLYGSTLQAFSAGDRVRARSLFRQARSANRRAVKYLTSDDEPPDVRDPFYQPGDESEAIMIAQTFGALWRSVPGALEWLKKEAKKR